MKKINFILLSLFFFSFNTFAFSPSEFDEEEFIVNVFWHKTVNLLKRKRPSVALVLGGGGARGFAHIEVFKVLEKEKV